MLLLLTPPNVTIEIVAKSNPKLFLYVTPCMFFEKRNDISIFLANRLENERFVFCFTQNGEYSLCSLILHCETSSDLLQKAGTTQNGSAKVLRKAYVARSKYTDKYAYTLFATLSEPRHKRLGQHRTVYVTRATLLSSDV